MVIFKGKVMNFCPERLIQVRTKLNINKAEAARRLNMSAMAYGRYEKGEREPSYQTVCYMAHVFHCDVNYLYGMSDNMVADYVIVSESESPELFTLVNLAQEHKGLDARLLAYARKIVIEELAAKDEQHTLKDEQLTQKDRQISEKDAIIAKLQEALKKQKGQ